MVETQKSQYTEYNVQYKCSEYTFLRTQLCFHLFREYYFDLRPVLMKAVPQPEAKSSL